MEKKWRRFAGASMAAAAMLFVCLAFPKFFDQQGAQEADAPVSLMTEGRMLIPGGHAVGIALKTQGVLVVAKGNRESAKSALRVGDVITHVCGQEIGSTSELAQCVSAAPMDRIELSVIRRGKTEMVSVQAVSDPADGRRRLGVWVRDSTAGVGTLSYIDPVTKAYGALGHAIVDGDTGDSVTVREGAVLRADIVGVVRGESGRAGELRGSFLKENDQIGTLDTNSDYGIFGHMDAMPEGLLYPQGLPIASRDEVHPGPATIISTVDGGMPTEYSIEILRCFEQDKPAQKGMILRVTDQRLLGKTGGIVQGMSGSPIIQEGKLIGAVTHVYLNDAAQGYGMYIEWMLERSDGMTGTPTEETNGSREAETAQAA